MRGQHSFLRVLRNLDENDHLIHLLMGVLVRTLRPAGVGLMEHAHRAALEAGRHSLALLWRLPWQQDPGGLTS